MSKNPLNDIYWDKIKIYHGTHNKYLDAILSKGFFIPNHDENWLGKGTYFAVNNIFLPILFSESHVKKADEIGDKNCYPVILEIKAKYLADNIKARILDLTSQQGLSLFHSISKDFVNFISKYDDFPVLEKELRRLEDSFANSPLYNGALKPHLLPNKDWFLLSLGARRTLDVLDPQSGPAKLLKDSSINITNIIFDWFNYKHSCGIETNIPIRGVMGNFNSGQGTPIALEKIFTGRKIDRRFADYISYLNRTELSIFGYDYYRSEDEKFWAFHRLFKDSPKKGIHYNTYMGSGPIRGLLESSFKITRELGLPIDINEIRDLINLIIKENDTN